jgi:flagellar protein FlbD
MFKLTKFTGETFLINPETILTVEEAGDTVVQLVTGERLLVKESAEEIQVKFMEFKQTISHPYSALSKI